MQRNIGLEWLAGFFDGEGCFSIQIRKDEDMKNDHILILNAKVNQTGVDSKKTINKCKKILNNEGIKCFVTKRRDKRKNRKNGWLLEITTRKDFKMFVEKIEPYIFNKKYELKRIKEDILPLIEQNKHTSKEGILKISQIKKEIYEYKDIQKSQRSKYNLEYFREKWDIDQNIEIDSETTT